MNKNDLFIEILKSGYLENSKLIKLILARPIGPNEIVNLTEDGYEVNLGTVYKIKVDNSKPLYSPYDMITVSKGVLKIAPDGIKDTVGSLIVNYLVFEYGLNGKIKYQNGQLDLENIIDNEVIPKLLNKSIKIDEFKNMANAVALLRYLADVVVIPVTEKVLYPPKDLGKVKKDKRKEFDSKYGKDWVKDPKTVLLYEESIQKYYGEYLQDDPTYGITIDKKMMGALKKLYVGLGILESVDPDADDGVVLSSLYDGFPDKPEEIASIINNIIFGSASRGIGTQEGGVVTKLLLRASHNYKILHRDCGVKYGETVKVENYNYKNYQNRYLVSGKLIENPKEYIGKVIEIRSPAYCKESGDNLCEICIGKTLSREDGAITLLFLMLGGMTLKHHLSKFHTVVKQIIKVNTDLLF